MLHDLEWTERGSKYRKIMKMPYLHYTFVTCLSQAMSNLLIICESLVTNYYTLLLKIFPLKEVYDCSWEKIIMYSRLWHCNSNRTFYLNTHFPSTKFSFQYHENNIISIIFFLEVNQTPLIVSIIKLPPSCTIY